MKIFQIRSLKGQIFPSLKNFMKCLHLKDKSKGGMVVSFPSRATTHPVLYYVKILTSPLSAESRTVSRLSPSPGKPVKLSSSTSNSACDCPNTSTTKPGEEYSPSPLSSPGADSDVLTQTSPGHHTSLSSIASPSTYATKAVRQHVHR